MDLVYGGAQIGARMGPEEGAGAFTDPAELESRRQAVDQATRRRAAEIAVEPGQKEHPLAAALGDISGQVIGTSPLMLVPGGAASLPARLATGAGVGAVAGSLQPVTEKDGFWGQKAEQAALGAAGGAGGEAALSTAGRVIAPKVSAAVRNLAGRGVQMTPGQLGAAGGMFGATVRRTEEVLKSYPILGNFIRAGETRSIEDFNRAAFDQTLSEIGSSLPRQVDVGHNAVAYTQKAISNAYDRLLAPLTFQADQEFFHNVGFQYLGQGGGIRLLQGQNILTPASRLTTPAMQREFTGIFRERVLNRINPRTGTMDGQTMKGVESELGQLARTYMSSADGRQKLIGQSILDVQGEIRDALARQNPQAAQQLQSINKAFASLARIEDAVTRRGASPDGVFRPTDLLAAAKAGDRSGRKRVYARGDALMQVLAKTAQKVLPGKVPDSGTTERGALLFGIWELLSQLGGSTEAGLAAVAPIALSPLYARPVSRGIQSYVVSGTRRQAAGKAVGDIGPYVDPAMGIMTSGQRRRDTLTIDPNYRP